MTGDPKPEDVGSFWKREKPSVAAAEAEEATQVNRSKNRTQRGLWVQ